MGFLVLKQKEQNYVMNSSGYFWRNDRFPVSTEVVSKWDTVTFNWLPSHDFVYSNGALMWGLSSSLSPKHPSPGSSIVIWIRFYQGYWYHLMSLVVYFRWKKSEYRLYFKATASSRMHFFNELQPVWVSLFQCLRNKIM